MAILLSKGHGVARDLNQSALWAQKAANQGLPAAEALLGQYYEDGIGVPDSLEKAKHWYLKAAEDKNAQAAFNLSALYFVDKDYRKNPALKQQAFQWLERSAELGSLEAAIKMSDIYFNGIQASPDYEKAFKWNSIAARKGDSCACWRLGWLYDFGRGVKQNPQEAKKWYEKAAAEDPRARERLVEMYKKGIGVPKDPVKAESLRKKFAIQSKSNTNLEDTLFPTKSP